MSYVYLQYLLFIYTRDISPTDDPSWVLLGEPSWGVQMIFPCYPFLPGHIQVHIDVPGV